MRRGGWCRGGRRRGCSRTAVFEDEVQRLPRREGRQGGTLNAKLAIVSARDKSATRLFSRTFVSRASSSSSSFQSGAMRDEGRRSEESASGRVIPTLAQIKNCNLRYLRGVSRRGTFSDCGRCHAFPDPRDILLGNLITFRSLRKFFPVETRRDPRIYEIEWIHEEDINPKFRVFSRSSQKSQRITYLRNLSN